MPVLFYPQDDEVASGTPEQKLEVLLESAERYKAAVLDLSRKNVENPAPMDTKKRGIPRDMTHAYNWDELAKVMREIRELPESNSAAKLVKAARLTKLAEVYEVLRGAKMAKLEAVRIALMNEANQLKGSAQPGTTQVA